MDHFPLSRITNPKVLNIRMSETSNHEDGTPGHNACKKCLLPLVRQPLICPDWNCRTPYSLHEHCGLEVYNAGQLLICRGCQRGFSIPLTPQEKLKRFLLTLLLMMFTPQFFASLYRPESLEGVDWIQGCLASICISFIALCFIFGFVVMVMGGQHLAEKIWLRITGSGGSHRISTIKQE